MSDAEKLRLLCVTGAVPRYLEEIRPRQSVAQNIKRMCFSPEGLLFSEFEKIFHDIFARRSGSFKRIVHALSGPALQPGELCQALGVKPTGDLSEKLAILVASSMVARDYSWDLSGQQTAISRYRIRDNYLRFYLRYIDGGHSKIAQGLYRDVHLENLHRWDTIIGLQLENLILNNLTALIRRLDIAPESIISASPYRQHQTKRHDACQVDLLIHTRNSVVYVCEIKFRGKIENLVIAELRQKIKRMLGMAGRSIRPVLIYHGELAPGIKESDFFSYLIPVGEFLHQ